MAETTRDRIIAAASALLAEGGREAISTRAVSTAANVQAPTIYRIFGDKSGLLDAVAGHGFQEYLRSKTSLGESDDPVEDLRHGWDLHVGFGLANPALYTLIYGEPRPGIESPAARAAAEVLAKQVRRIALAGRLRVSEERAAHMIHSAGCGTTLTLIAIPEERRDPGLSAMSREAVIAAVTTGAPQSTPADAQPVNRAVALRALLPQVTVLTDAERTLLAEWLDRIATAGSQKACPLVDPEPPNRLKI
ncbi:TetR/AcrR family transcriptional regulator [Nonomuraea africana]|uniref:AcrR family transcriptional regulator n=1 Tax=Nonomuraea africana TaxID=46171 RepID=A0ABR9KAI3_9ACTN|nr:TetR/AcrR family transcriptional regulator [Nonomuraea africana]MBE1559011.1 AcrR family transcriptional regulator [Nonomuraea africana]